MKARNFRKMKNRPYTRREYIDGIPGSKVVKYTMGSPDKDFDSTLRARLPLQTRRGTADTPRP